METDLASLCKPEPEEDDFQHEEIELKDLGVALGKSGEPFDSFVVESGEKEAGEVTGEELKAEAAAQAESTGDATSKAAEKPSPPAPLKTKTGSVGPVLVYSLIVCVGGVLGGYSHGYPSPTLLDLQEAYERGDRVTAFSSSSIYAGLFGVSSPTPSLAPPT